MRRTSPGMSLNSTILFSPPPSRLSIPASPTTANSSSTRKKPSRRRKRTSLRNYNLSITVNERLLEIFRKAYREVRPRAPMPELKTDYFPFANINSTIRMREGKLLVRVSDVLEGAPEPVLRSLAHILLGKMYRRPIAREHTTRYRDRK